MKCQLCSSEPDTLYQVVMKINKEADTSSFAYKMVCASCVEQRDLRRAVIREKKAKN